MQSLLRNLCYAIVAGPTLNQDLPTRKPLELVVLNKRGSAVFAMKSMLCNFAEPTLSQALLEIHCS